MSQDPLAKCSVNVAIVLQRRLGLLQYGCDRDMPSSTDICIDLTKSKNNVAKAEISLDSVLKLQHNRSQNQFLAA